MILTIGKLLVTLTNWFSSVFWQANCLKYRLNIKFFGFRLRLYRFFRIGGNVEVVP